MKIAIDAMGGDHAPVETCKAAVEALAETKAEIVLIGREEVIRAELSKYQYDQARISIIHADEVVENEDKPVKAIKEKKNSSMVVGMTLLKEGAIDGLVSAGNTGALLAGGLLKVGRIKGIDRPALCSVYPTSKGISVLIDAGANADCKPRNLYEFGIMGSIYAEKVLSIANPTVGIVNIGAEAGKGNALMQESYELMQKASYNFVGNVEARNIPAGEVDVIVCDGFTGNVILKLSEGVVKSFSTMMKEQFMKSVFTKIGALLLKNGLQEMKKTMDYTEYGGAPFLGVNGMLMKAHGSSNSKALKNAVKYTEKCVENGVLAEIKKALAAEIEETVSQQPDADASDPS